MFSEIPESVVAVWEKQAEDPTERQLQHHKTKDHDHPAETCWMCARQRAICKSKVRYESLDAATAACDAYNSPTSERLMDSYRCYWSVGMHWHLTTARSTGRRKRARKRMARRYAQETA